MAGEWVRGIVREIRTVAIAASGASSYLRCAVRAEIVDMGANNDTGVRG